MSTTIRLPAELLTAVDRQVPAELRTAVDRQARDLDLGRNRYVIRALERARARSLDGALAGDNVSHMSRIPGLRIENRRMSPTGSPPSA